MAKEIPTIPGDPTGKNLDYLPVKIQQAIHEQKENLHIHKMMWEHLAQEKKIKFDFLIKAGFTEEQALKLIPPM